MSVATEFIDYLKTRVENVTIANGYNSDLGLSPIDINSFSAVWDTSLHFVGAGSHATPDNSLRTNISFELSSDDKEPAANEIDLLVNATIEVAQYLPNPTADKYEDVFKPLHEDLLKLVVEAPPLSDTAFAYTPAIRVILLSQWYHDTAKELCGVVMNIQTPITINRGDL